MPKKKTNAHYERRDVAFLAHVARYRVGLYPSLSQVLFEASGKPIGSIAAKLETKGLVHVHKRAINGGINFVSITTAGCRRLANVPVERGAKYPASSALDQAIGVSFFCCLARHRRHRLETTQLRNIFEDSAPPENAPHILSDERGAPCVYRAFQPAVGTAKAIKRLRDLIKQAQENEKVRPWLLQGDYGYAILAPSDASRKSLDEAVGRSKLDSDYSIIVGLGPTAETLKTALRNRKKKYS